MSVYRQPARVSRTALIAGVAGALVIGLVVGFALGRGTASDPSLADKLSALRDDLRPARQGIELAPTEYAQAVRAGRVVAPTEYGAARSDAERARRAFASVRSDLRRLDRAGADALERALAGLSGAIDRREPAARVRLAAAAAGRALEAVTP